MSYKPWKLWRVRALNKPRALYGSGQLTDHEFSMGVPKEEWDDDPYTSVSRRLAKMLQNDSLKFSEEGFRSLVF